MMLSGVAQDVLSVHMMLRGLLVVSSRGGGLLLQLIGLHARV